MVIWLLRNLLYLRTAIKSTDTPRMLAISVALGMILGMVPKGNLLAVGLVMGILATRVNVAVAMISALGFSLIGPMADPLTHRLGLWVLTRPALWPHWARLYELPLAPWTSFNNTVVMGSFLLGVALFYPSYRASLPMFERRAARAKSRGPETTSRVPAPTTEPGSHPQDNGQQDSNPPDHDQVDRGPTGLDSRASESRSPASETVSHSLAAGLQPIAAVRDRAEVSAEPPGTTEPAVSLSTADASPPAANIPAAPARHGTLRGTPSPVRADEAHKTPPEGALPEPRAAALERLRVKSFDVLQVSRKWRTVSPETPPPSAAPSSEDPTALQRTVREN